MCYVLHGFLVVFHLALMVVFANHTEHHVVIPLDSTGITTILSASLQLSYTVCSSKLDLHQSDIRFSYILQFLFS